MKEDFRSTKVDLKIPAYKKPILVGIRDSKQQKKKGLCSRDFCLFRKTTNRKRTRLIARSQQLQKK